MTEQEILKQLADNDIKIVRALCEKDDALILLHNQQQEALREQLAQMRAAV